MQQLSWMLAGRSDHCSPATSCLLLLPGVHSSQGCFDDSSQSLGVPSPWGPDVGASGSAAVKFSQLYALPSRLMCAIPCLVLVA
jgi:hypothetical protein